MQIFLTIEQIENAITSCRTVTPYLPEIEEVPAKLKALTVELEQLKAQIARTQQVLVCERSTFIAERRRLANEDDLSRTMSKLDQQDYEATLEKRRSELLGIQNEIASGHKKLAEIVREHRRLVRMAR
jgi:hypothetical protein